MTFKDTPQTIELDVLFHLYQDGTPPDVINTNITNILGDAKAYTAVVLLCVGGTTTDYNFWNKSSVGLPRRDRSGTDIERLILNSSITRWFNKTAQSYLNEYGQTMSFNFSGMPLFRWGGLHHIDNPYTALPADLVAANMSPDTRFASGNWLFFCNHYSDSDKFAPSTNDLIIILEAYGNKLIRNQTLTLTPISSPIDISILGGAVLNPGVESITSGPGTSIVGPLTGSTQMLKGLIPGFGTNLVDSAESITVNSFLTARENYGWFLYVYSTIIDPTDSGIIQFVGGFGETCTAINVNKRIYQPPPNDVSSLFNESALTNGDLIITRWAVGEALYETQYTVTSGFESNGDVFNLGVTYRAGNRQVSPPENILLTVGILKVSAMFGSLADVNVAAIPAQGQAVHFAGAEWVQSPELYVDPTSKNIIFATTGSIGLTNNGVLDKDISVQSGRELLLQSGTQLTIDGESAVVVKAGDGGSITFTTNNISAFQMETDGTLRSTKLDYTPLVTDDNDMVNKGYVDNATGPISDKLTIGGDAKGIGISAGTNDDFPFFLKQNNIPFLTNLDNEVTLNTSGRLNLNSATADAFLTASSRITLSTVDGPIRFDMGSPSDNVLFIGTALKTASQYATDITGAPNAIPNVQYVDDAVGAISGNVILNGGNSTPLIDIRALDGAFDTDVIKVGLAVGQDLFSAQGWFGGASTDTVGRFNCLTTRNFEFFTANQNNSHTAHLDYSTGSVITGLHKAGDVRFTTGRSIEGSDATYGGDIIFSNAFGNRGKYVMQSSTGTFRYINTAITNYETRATHIDDFQTRRCITDNTMTLSNKSLVDSTTFFTDDLTPSKRMQFQLSGVTSGVTRTLTIPDADGTIVLNTTAITQGGNSFGTAMTIGTNDAFDVNIERAGVSAFNFNATGITMLPQGVTNSFFLRAPSTANLGAALSIIGGTPTSVSTFAPGGAINILSGNAAVNGGAAAVGGALVLTAGTSVRQNGADVTITGGLCNNDNTNNLRGGNVNITSGLGMSFSVDTVKSGDINISAAGGNTRVGAGNINITCLPMGVGVNNKNGGIITLTASDKVNNGVPGSIRLYHKTGVGVTVEGDGILSTNTPLYETLVLNDNDFPNRKFVVDLSNTKVTKGGDTGASLIIGTNDAQPMQLRTNGTPAFTVEINGRMDSNITGYESLVTVAGDNAIPNRKYVVDKIDAQLLGAHADTAFTLIADGNLIRYDVGLTKWVNYAPPLYYAYWDDNATSSLGIQNNINWMQGTYVPTFNRGFSEFTDNAITYSGLGTRTFEVTYSGTPIVGSNDRTMWLTAYKGSVTAPILSLNPVGPAIGGSRAVEVLRTSITDTTGVANTFTVTLTTDDYIRFYVTNKENNDAITMTDWRVSMRVID